MTRFSRCLRQSWISLLAGLPVLACLACTGGGTDLAAGSIGTIINNAKKNTFFITVGNSTTNQVQLTLRVDGVDKTLIPCPAAKTYTYALSSCPNQIELIQEVELGPAGEFMSGRNFEGNANFRFQLGQYECGGQILFQVTDTGITVQPL